MKIQYLYKTSATIADFKSILKSTIPISKLPGSQTILHLRPDVMCIDMDIRTKQGVHFRGRINTVKPHSSFPDFKVYLNTLDLNQVFKHVKSGVVDIEWIDDGHPIKFSFNNEQEAHYIIPMLAD